MTVNMSVHARCDTATRCCKLDYKSQLIRRACGRSLSLQVHCCLTAKLKST